MRVAGQELLINNPLLPPEVKRGLTLVDEAQLPLPGGPSVQLPRDELQQQQQQPQWRPSALPALQSLQQLRAEAGEVPWEVLRGEAVEIEDESIAKGFLEGRLGPEGRPREPPRPPPALRGALMDATLSSVPVDFDTVRCGDCWGLTVGLTWLYAYASNLLICEPYERRLMYSHVTLSSPPDLRWWIYPRESLREYQVST